MSGWGIDGAVEKRAPRAHGFVLVAVLVLGAFGTACDGDPVSDSTPVPTTTPVVQTPPPDTSLDELVGVDLARAVKRLERRGYDVDLSRLPRGARVYASGFATHPMVVVTDLEVRNGTVVVLGAECPERSPC